MEISKDILKSHSPCVDGYVWFLENYGKDAKVEYEELYNKLPYSDWKDWLKKHFWKKPDTHPDYKGRFKVGQEVYRQYHGIGTWNKVRIYEIDQNTNADTGFHCLVDDNFHSCRNCVEECNLFSTFDEIKAHWIREINNLKE